MFAVRILRNSMEKSKNPSQLVAPAPAKAPYEKPTLVRLGSFLELTQAKLGTKSDGAGKPVTRLSGPST